MDKATKLITIPSSIAGGGGGLGCGIAVKHKLQNTSARDESVLKKMKSDGKKQIEEKRKEKDLCKDLKGSSVGSKFKGKLLCNRETDKTKGEAKLTKGKTNKPSKFTIQPIWEGESITIEDLQDKCKVLYAATHGNSISGIGEDTGTYCSKDGETKPTGGGTNQQLLNK